MSISAFTSILVITVFAVFKSSATASVPTDAPISSARIPEGEWFVSSAHSDGLLFNISALTAISATILSIEGCASVTIFVSTCVAISNFKILFVSLLGVCEIGVS
uniref:Uncharacterized protein n=1 Tax=Candidatus Berkiella cookevillensis TaxID=437022 RepID=A0A0Q9YJU3_9GAMM